MNFVRKALYYFLLPLFLFLDEVYYVIINFVCGNHPFNLNFIKYNVIQSRFGKMEKLRWRLLNWLYVCIRFIRHWPYDFNINEDRQCMICGKPLLFRGLNCGSLECVEEGKRLEYW
jgi:hypothetical protein